MEPHSGWGQIIIGLDTMVIKLLGRRKKTRSTATTFRHIHIAWSFVDRMTPLNVMSALFTQLIHMASRITLLPPFTCSFFPPIGFLHLLFKSGFNQPVVEFIRCRRGHQNGRKGVRRRWRSFSASSRDSISDRADGSSSLSTDLSFTFFLRGPRLRRRECVDGIENVLEVWEICFTLRLGRSRLLWRCIKPLCITFLLLRGSKP